MEYKEEVIEVGWIVLLTFMSSVRGFFMARVDRTINGWREGSDDGGRGCSKVPLLRLLWLLTRRFLGVVMAVLLWTVVRVVPACPDARGSGAGRGGAAVSGGGGVGGVADGGGSSGSSAPVRTAGGTAAATPSGAGRAGGVGGAGIRRGGAHEERHAPGLPEGQFRNRRTHSKCVCTWEVNADHTEKVWSRLLQGGLLPAEFKKRIRRINKVRQPDMQIRYDIYVDQGEGDMCASIGRVLQCRARWHRPYRERVRARKAAEERRQTTPAQETSQKTSQQQTQKKVQTPPVQEQTNRMSERNSRCGSVARSTARAPPYPNGRPYYERDVRVANPSCCADDEAVAMETGPSGACWGLPRPVTLVPDRGQGGRGYRVYSRATAASPRAV